MRRFARTLTVTEIPSRAPKVWQTIHFDGGQGLEAVRMEAVKVIDGGAVLVGDDFDNESEYDGAGVDREIFKSCFAAAWFQLF